MTTPKSFLLTAELHDYLVEHSSPLDDIDRELIAATARLGDIAVMQVAPEQGALLTMLARLLGAQQAVEVGTFTGYSALCIARGLEPDGGLVCCDVSAEWTAVGQPFWSRAGLSERIDLRLGPAIETLRAMPSSQWIDLAFLDADKIGYIDYYEELVPRLRSGGLLLADNVLWSGRVVDRGATGDDVEVIRRFNDHVVADARVDVVMLPVADGLTLCRRR